MPNTNSRYQMRARIALPKFGSPKNPFAPPPPNVESPGANVNASPAKLETASLFEPAPQEPIAKEPVKPAVAKESKTPPLRPAIVAPPAKVEAKAAPSPAPLVPSSKPGRLSGWVKKLNPLSLLPPRRGEGSRGRPARKHVQTELTLEKVRVVRNDLSDADLNIVPGRLMGLPSGASPILPHGGSSNGEPGAWSRLTSKFIGAQHAEIR